jgi:hypothetical protein
MKEFGVFIPKLHNPLRESLPPVFLFHRGQISGVIFNYYPEFEFMRKQASILFQLIQESNSHIAVGNEAVNIREVFSSKLQNSSEQLEFGTDHTSSIINMNRGEPSIGDLLHTIGMIVPNVCKPKYISLGERSANLNLAKEGDQMWSWPKEEPRSWGTEKSKQHK